MRIFLPHMQFRRGFIFTIDAILAIGMAMAVIASIAVFSDTPSTRGQTQFSMQRQTSDIAAILSKSGALATSLGGNRTAAAAIISYTDAGKCFSIVATNSTSGKIAFALEKSGCKSPGADSSTAVRSEVYNGTPLFVTVSGWTE